MTETVQSLSTSKSIILYYHAINLYAFYHITFMRCSCDTDRCPLFHFSARYK